MKTPAFRTLTAATCVLLMTCMHADAVIIADYQFTNTGDYFSSDTDPGSSAADLVVSGVTATFSGLGNPARSLYFSTGWLDSTATVANNRYLSVTVTPEAGFEIDYTSFDFEIAIDSTEFDAPRQYGLFSSVDGFTSVIATGSTLPFDGVFNGKSIDLSGSAFQDVTAATEFRLVLFDRAVVGTPSDRELRIDNITINGSTVAVPEPSLSAFMIGAGVLAGLFIQRRHRQRL